jgi:fatty-acyl-CoA synthase
LLDRIPLRVRGVTHIASPLFHSWGDMHFGLASAVSATIVLRRSFDAEALLASVGRDRVDTLVVVPTMLARILELPCTTRRRYDTSSLRVVVVSGSALHGDLATRFMQEYGEILYNLYGSTEVSWAAIATPADLRAAPVQSDVPRVAPEWRSPTTWAAACPRDRAGGSSSATERRSTAPPAVAASSVGALLRTGDIGHIDDAGRLFVDGGEDDMIVSGGENIFPSEVEDVLARHPGVDLSRGDDRGPVRVGRAAAVHARAPRR